MEAEARVKKMKDLLVSSDFLCKAVALEAGMREDSGARLFRRKVGMTMREYRSKHRKKIPPSNRGT